MAVRIQRTPPPSRPGGNDLTIAPSHAYVALTLSELSMQETRTAGLAERHLRETGYDVTAGIGKTGVVGVLRNGDGPIVMLRPDMDAWPIREATVNDKEASDKVAGALRAHFPAEQVPHTGPAPASEDFGCFATAWHAPSVYYFIGGTNPNVYAKAKAEGRVNELPVNHSPNRALVCHSKD